MKTETTHLHAKDKPTLITLDSGFRILCQAMEERDSAAIGIWAAAGSRDESARLNGISHFLEHMLFKGTSRRSAQEISQEIEGRGGTLNGFTSEETTCYWAKVRSQDLPQAIDVLLDLFFHPRLHPREIDKERGVVREEIRMNRDHPASHVHHLIQESMWPAQPLGRPILGTERTIGAISRRELNDYQRVRYHPKHAAVVACGNLDPEKVTAAVKKRLPRVVSRRAAGGQRARYTRSPSTVAVEKRPIEQSNLCLGLQALPRLHPDIYALNLLNIILGANMSSRLFREMREKRGWAYYVRSGIDAYRDSGALVVDAGVPPERAEESVRLILRELRRLCDRPPGAEEFARAREYFLGQTALYLEQTLNRMLWLGEYLVCAGRFFTPDEIAEKIGRVTPERIRDLARRLFASPRFCLALVGPRDDEKRLRRVLGDGA
jgi:predicted Zn-dependent peptidase